jgi:hypothetical protein
MYDKNKKYFLITIEEKNGEQEYSHDSIVEAKTLKKAEKIGEKIAENWYDNEDGLVEKNEDGYYEHLGGCIFVAVHSVEEITPIEYFERKLR